jgi:tRNA-specific 2-thiouridylase
LTDPIYVVRLDIENRQVVVGPKEMLATRQVRLKEVNWLGDKPLSAHAEWSIAAKVRSTRPPRDAVLRPLSETEAEVELMMAEEGVAPGQACVFYDAEGSRVLGGGWITRG